MAADLEPWQIALIAVAAFVVVVLVLVMIAKAWAKAEYHRQLQNPPTELDIDAFVGGIENNPVSYFKVALGGKITIGNRTPSSDPIPLQVYKSEHVDGLWKTRRAGTGDGGDDAISMEQLFSESKKKPIVVATLRMGFGHHRLAYSAASWAMKAGHPTVFHDLLSIPSDEAALIKSTDEWYSKCSRWASEMGGLVERFWGSMMMQGDADALRMAAYTAGHLQPLLLSVPKDTPIITTHQWVALIASAAGFTNVTNLVIDNHPQVSVDCCLGHSTCESN